MLVAVQHIALVRTRTCTILNVACTEATCVVMIDFWAEVRLDCEIQSAANGTKTLMLVG